MTSGAYFAKSKGAFPAVGVVGVESEWMDVGPLEVPAGSLWAGDPRLMDDQRAPVIKVPKGTYRVQVKGMDFKGHRRTARVRAFLGDGDPSPGKRRGQTITDSAWVGICDYAAYRKAVTRRRAQEYQDDIALATKEEGIGVIRFEYGGKAFEMALQPSGLGDGTFAVFPLVRRGKTVGMEVEFLLTGFRLDKAIPGAAGAEPAADKKRAARERELFRACEKGKVDVVRRLLKEDPDLIRAQGTVGLLNTISPLQVAALNGRADVAEVLLKAGHPVDAADEDGGTPLIDASTQGHVEVVRLLLKHKADVNRRKVASRETALHGAAFPGRGKAQIVKLLLDAGADPKARDDDRTTPAGVARQYLGAPYYAKLEEELTRVLELLERRARRK
jgi:hypothetical protein